MEMFSEIEQEEIINEFLNKIQKNETHIIDNFLCDKSEEEIEEDDIKKSFITEKKI